MTSDTTFEKGWGTLTQPDETTDIHALGWNLLREDLSLPAALIVEPRLEHNLRWMAEFARRYGVQLAPHGKTSMAPELFGRQLKAGAWGITLATAHQCAVAHAHGVRRILMANQLLGRANCELVSSVIAEDTTFYTLVDSPALVDQLGSFFASKGQQLQVLVELGVEGGRTGTRTDEQLQAVLQALERWRTTLLLCGVEVYEGVTNHEAEVRNFLSRAVETFQQLRKQSAFSTERPILSGAGSAWYDLVADAFAPLHNEADVLLRPGCYLTCDAGVYRTAQRDITERNSTAHETDEQFGGTLRSAIEVWAYVQSVPERGLAIVGLGKRDVAFDAGMPAPVLHFRPGKHSHPVEVQAGWAITKLMDQHAYLSAPEHADLQVGDMLGFEISHPCLTFDKWRCLALVDAQYNVLKAIRTYF